MDKSFTFAGLEISQGPVFFHQGRFIHPESFPVPYGWKINSFGKTAGKNDGSTYFNWNEVQGLNIDGWRIPTKDEWDQIIELHRPGTVYNDKPGSCFALIQVDVPFAGRETCNGVLLYPDDTVINGVEIGNINQIVHDDGYKQTTNVTEDELNALLKQGCVFLPASGFCYDEDDWYNGGYGGYYWTSTQKDADDAWRLNFYSREIATDDNGKSNDYYSVRLVRE